MSKQIRTLLGLTIATLGAGILAQQAQAIELNFGNTPGGQIVFGGANNFSFTPDGVASGGNNSFRITGSSGLGILVIGDFGTMTAPLGGWTFNPVSGVVSGTGTLDIRDPSNAHLKADLTFIKLDVNTPGTGGQFNENLVLNLSTITYSGIDPDLLAVAAAKVATETLSFTFPTTGHTLANLGSVAQHTSFSGSLIATNIPDGGATLALLGFAILGVEGLRRKLSK